MSRCWRTASGTPIRRVLWITVRARALPGASQTPARHCPRADGGPWRAIANLVRIRDLHRVLPDDRTVVAIRLKVGRRRALTEDQTRRLNRLRFPGAAAMAELVRELAAGALVACISDIRRFTLVAGPAPVSRQSEKITGWRRTFGGDKALKQVFCQGVCTTDPTLKACYDRKRGDGKRHAPALIAAARRRVTMLWTMRQHRDTFDSLRIAA